jgi:copper transport protein
VNALIAPVRALQSGAYRVVWRVVSDDGHPVGGSFVFWVGGSSAAPPPAPHSADAPVAWGPVLLRAPVIPAALRGAGVGSLMALGGLLFFLAWSGGAPSRRTSRLVGALAFAAVALLGAHLIAWLVNVVPEHTLASESVSVALASGLGKVEALRVVLALLALWAVWLARRARLALFFATAALIVSGASGHSAAIHPMWAMPAKSIHLLAGAAWLGGLLWLVTRARSVEGVSGADFVREASRVSSVALVAVIVVTASGLLQALLFLPSPLDVFHSAYGAIVLAKIAGVLVLIGFGAFHRYRALPGLTSIEGSRGRLASSLRSEIAVMILVVLVGGLLAYVPPPSEQPMHDMHAHTQSE